MDPLSQGLQLVQAAVEADQCQDYPKAIRLYEQSLGCLFQATQYEQDPGKRSLIESKGQEYATRVTFLKQVVAQGSPQQSPPHQPQQLPGMGYPQPPPSSHNQQPPSHHTNPNIPSPQTPPPQQFQTSSPPSVPSSGGSPHDSLQMPDVLPMVAEYAYKYPVEKKDLGAALELAREAQKQDNAQNFQAALDLYVDVVDRLRLIREASDSENMKKSLSETMASYLTRAEKIKAGYPNLNPRLRPKNLSPSRAGSFDQQGGAHFQSQNRAGSQPNFNQPTQYVDNHQRSGSSITTYDAMLAAQGANAGPLPTSPFDLPSAGNRAIPSTSMAAPSDDEFVRQMKESEQRVLPVSAGQRGGTGDSVGGKEVRVENQRKGYGKPMFLTAKMSDNLVRPEERVKIYVEVRNQSSTPIKCLKLKLRRIIKNLKTESSGKNSLKVEKEDIKSIDFYQGSVFPLPAEADYKGYVEFDIPKALMETNVEHKGYFEREYEFKLECVLQYHRNLPVYIPIVVGKA